MTHAIGPADGSLEVRTFREGKAAMVGHDLVLTVENWRATIDVDRAHPARGRVAVVAAADSLRVASATGGVTPIGPREFAEIEKSTRDKVLQSARYPEIHFESTGMGLSGSALVVNGRLTLCGVVRETRLDLVVSEVNRGWRATGRARLRQGDWGIKPYAAFFGTLRVADEVEVAIDVLVRG